jgi:hypothetical protein
MRNVNPAQASVQGMSEDNDEIVLLRLVSQNLVSRKNGLPGRAVTVKMNEL